MSRAQLTEDTKFKVTTHLNYMPIANERPNIKANRGNLNRVNVTRVIG